MEYVIDVEATTLGNDNFRWVFQTSKQLQYVFMSLLPKQDIGEEIHPITTQFIRIESGTGLAIVGGEKYYLNSKSSVFIPAGTKHNIINTGAQEMKLYTLYSPPQHKQGLVQKYKPLED